MLDESTRVAAAAGSDLIDLHLHRVVKVNHAWVAFVALTALMLGLATEADLVSLICGAEQLCTPTQRSC